MQRINQTINELKRMLDNERQKKAIDDETQILIEQRCQTFVDAIIILESLQDTVYLSNF